jgi:hypothetical protein
LGAAPASTAPAAAPIQPQRSAGTASQSGDDPDSSIEINDTDNAYYTESILAWHFILLGVSHTQ